MSGDHCRRASLSERDLLAYLLRRWPDLVSMTNPYAVVSSWWGDELDAMLIERISQAPQEHLDEFQEYWFHEVESNDRWLPDLDPGKLRPILAHGTMDLVDGRKRAHAIPSLALPLLMYAHELVVDDIVPNLWSPAPQERRDAAAWLAKVRPLFDLGVLHFRVLGRKRHPAAHNLYGDLIDEALSIEDNHIDELLRRVAPEVADVNARMHLRQGLILNLLSDVTTFYAAFERTWPGKVHRLLRSNAEYSMLRWAFARSGVARQDRPDINLLQLAQMSVPYLTPRRMQELVQLRQSEENFAELRVHLRRGLELIQVADLAERAELAEARATLAAELEPITQRLESAVKKSPALESLQAGVSSFAVSTVGAAAGAAIGGNLAAAVISAATIKAGEGVLKFVRAYKDRRLASGTLDLITSYLEPLRGE